MNEPMEHNEAYAITLARVREVFHDVRLCRQEQSNLNVLPPASSDAPARAVAVAFGVFLAGNLGSRRRGHGTCSENP